MTQSVRNGLAPSAPMGASEYEQDVPLDFTRNAARSRENRDGFDDPPSYDSVMNGPSKSSSANPPPPAPPSSSSFSPSGYTSSFSPSGYTSSFSPSGRTSTSSPSGYTSSFSPSGRTSSFSPSGRTSSYSTTTTTNVPLPRVSPNRTVYQRETHQTGNGSSVADTFLMTTTSGGEVTFTTDMTLPLNSSRTPHKRSGSQTVLCYLTCGLLIIMVIVFGIMLSQK